MFCRIMFCSSSYSLYDSPRIELFYFLLMKTYFPVMCVWSCLASCQSYILCWYNWIIVFCSKSWALLIHRNCHREMHRCGRIHFIFCFQKFTVDFLKNVSHGIGLSSSFRRIENVYCLFCDKIFSACLHFPVVWSRWTVLRGCLWILLDVQLLCTGKGLVESSTASTYC